MATNKSLITWIFCYFSFRSYGYAKKNEHRPQYQARLPAGRHLSSPFVNILKQLLSSKFSLLKKIES